MLKVKKRHSHSSFNFQLRMYAKQLGSGYKCFGLSRKLAFRDGLLNKSC